MDFPSQNQRFKNTHQAYQTNATNQSQQNASYRNSTSLSQSRHQFFSTIGNVNNNSQFQIPIRSRPTDESNLNPADSMMIGIRNHNNLLSSSNILSTHHQTLLSPHQLDDQNRLFALYSPSEHDIYSPYAFAQSNSTSNIFQMMGTQNNQRGFVQVNEQQSSGGIHQEILQHQIDVMQHFQQQRSIKNQEQDIQIQNKLDTNENPNPLPEEKPEIEKDILEKRLKHYSSIVMQQTFFNHLSLQIFFVLVLVMIIYKIHYSSILIFLWIVDIVSFSYSFKRSRIEIEVDPTKQDDMNNLWRILETFFSIIFKVCLYIYMEVDHYKFYYVPCSLLVYVLIRFFFVISKKLTENGPISTLLNESFTWGFKIFFVGQLFLITIKMSDKIDWSWQDVFWPYWVFFYIMIGTNSVFVILLLSKILLKCLGQPVESFEIKGLFWFFMLSNGLCVNSTLFVRGIISYLEHINENDAQKAFKYCICFIFTFVVYTMLFWKGIWVFMFHFSQEREEQLDTSMRNDSQMKSSRIKRRNKNERQSQNTSKQSQASSEIQQNGIDCDEEQQDEEYDDGEEEDDEEEIYNQGLYPDGEQDGNGTSDRQNSQIENQNQNIQQKKKTFKKVNLSFKGNEKKGIPLFLEKLSSTYFTVFTNNGIKKKKKEGNIEANKSKSFNKSASCQQNEQKFKKDQLKNVQKLPSLNVVNKSDIQSGATHKQNQYSKKEKLKQVQLQIDSAKGLSDSLRNIEISFNGETGKKLELPKEKNSLSRLAYDTQVKFSQMIMSPKGQELKKKELEKRNQRNQINTEENNYNNSNYNQNAIQDDQSPGQKEKSCEESNIQCVICYENEPDTVYLPCGHGGICYECGMDVIKKTGECYLCRNEIQQVVQIDLKSKDTQKKVIAVTAALEDKSEYNDPDYSISNNCNSNLNVSESAIDNQQPIRESQNNDEVQEQIQEQDMQLEPAIYGGRQDIKVPEVENLTDQNEAQLENISFQGERKKLELMVQLSEDQNQNGVLFSSGREGANSEKKCINNQIEQGSDQYLVNICSNDS